METASVPSKKIIENLINKIVDIENTMNSVVQTRLNDIESKINKIDSDISLMKTSMIDINNMIFTEPDLYKTKPIQPSYISTVLSKIDMLKNAIQDYLGDIEQCEFSPLYLSVKSIEDQILQNNRVSEKQLNDLNNIYMKIVHYKRKQL